MRPALVFTAARPLTPRLPLPAVAPGCAPALPGIPHFLLLGSCLEHPTSVLEPRAPASCPCWSLDASTTIGDRANKTAGLHGLHALHRRGFLGVRLLHGLHATCD